jgi:hypothetical protein
MNLNLAELLVSAVDIHAVDDLDHDLAGLLDYITTDIRLVKILNKCVDSLNDLNDRSLLAAYTIKMSADLVERMEILRPYMNVVP